MIITRIYLGLTTKEGTPLNYDEVLIGVKLAIGNVDINSATIYRAVGIWNREKEESLIIELWDVELFTAKNLSLFFKGKYNQETVAFTRQRVDLLLTHN